MHVSDLIDESGVVGVTPAGDALVDAPRMAVLPAAGGRRPLTPLPAPDGAQVLANAYDIDATGRVVGGTTIDPDWRVPATATRCRRCGQRGRARPRS
jgi:hypothetical protein